MSIEAFTAGPTVGVPSRGDRTVFAPRRLLPTADGLFLCGGFNTRTESPFFSKLDPATGAVRPELGAVFDAMRSSVAGVSTADIRGNRLVAVGNFERVRGQTRFGVAALTLPNLAADAGFFASALTDGHVFALAAQPDGKVIVGEISSLPPRCRANTSHACGPMARSTRHGTRARMGTCSRLPR